MLNPYKELLDEFEKKGVIKDRNNLTEMERLIVIFAFMSLTIKIAK